MLIYRESSISIGRLLMNLKELNFKELALCFKALGDETRVKIVEMLKNGKLCANEILENFKITQPTLSYHMKMLVECGIISYEKKGLWNYYTLNIEKMNWLSQYLNIFLRHI